MKFSGGRKDGMLQAFKRRESHQLKNLVTQELKQLKDLHSEILADRNNLQRILKYDKNLQLLQQKINEVNSHFTNLDTHFNTVKNHLTKTKKGQNLSMFHSNITELSNAFSKIDKHFSNCKEHISILNEKINNIESALNKRGFSHLPAIYNEFKQAYTIIRNNVDVTHNEYEHLENSIQLVSKVNSFIKNNVQPKKSYPTEINSAIKDKTKTLTKLKTNLNFLRKNNNFQSLTNIKIKN